MDNRAVLGHVAYWLTKGDRAETQG